MKLIRNLNIYKISIIEYIVLRLLRRYCFSGNLLEKFGDYLPFYKKNYNLLNPASVVDKYENIAKKNEIDFQGKNVLELGPGVTNSTAYELTARGCKTVYAYEPFAKKNLKAELNY